jgi:hypothetical protein
MGRAYQHTAHRRHPERVRATNVVLQPDRPKSFLAARFTSERLAVPVSADDLADSLAAAIDLTPTELAANVQSFLRDLMELGAVIETDAAPARQG